MRYTMESTLTVGHGNGRLHKNEYALVYNINVIKQVGLNATIYDKSLNMYFEDISKIATVFEVETEKASLDLDPSLAKSHDLLRRSLYRYDWICVRINRMGKILSIENTDEIKSQWNEKRKLMRNDYQGKQVDDYINLLDAQMSSAESMAKYWNQYFYTGLLFPHIPSVHDEGWSRDRVVMLSDFEDMEFNERIRYKDTESKIRHYTISGVPVASGENSLTDKFSGSILVPIDDIHPLQAEVEIGYTRNGHAVNWIFKLTKN